MRVVIRCLTLGTRFVEDWTGRELAEAEAYAAMWTGWRNGMQFKAEVVRV